MFIINLLHYYMLCFRSHASCNKKY